MTEAAEKAEFEEADMIVEENGEHIWLRKRAQPLSIE